MAPRTIRSGPERAKQRIQNDEVPPSSTFAAQIVDGLTKPRQTLKSDRQANFRQLLQEILDADQNEGHHTAVETNVQVNSKLIYVTVRAGLEVLPKDNPFDHQADLQKQALNSLAVIDLTIRRSPEVLFFVPERSDNPEKPRTPLFLWLVPQLLKLLGHHHNENLRKAVIRVLGTAISAQRSLSTLRTKIAPIQKYVQGCIKGQDRRVLCDFLATDMFYRYSTRP